MTRPDALVVRDAIVAMLDLREIEVGPDTWRALRAWDRDRFPGVLDLSRADIADGYHGHDTELSVRITVEVLSDEELGL